MTMNLRIYLSTIYLISLVHSKDLPRPIELTYESWSNMLRGEWLVKFYAPWCPACRKINSLWDGLAKRSENLDLTVSKIDISENPGLMVRFLITSLPTIYHIKDGNFRLYKGVISESAMINYINNQKYKSKDPVPWYKSPNSLHMSVLGSFSHGVTVMVRFLTTMTEQYGVPSWATYILSAVITILIGVILGLIMHCIFYNISFSVRHTTPARQSTISDDKNNEKKNKLQDDESNIVEDKENIGLRKRTT